MKFIEIDNAQFYKLSKDMSQCEKGIIYGSQYRHAYEILDGTIEYATRVFDTADEAKVFVAEYYEGVEVKSQMDLFDVL